MPRKARQPPLGTMVASCRRAPLFTPADLAEAAEVAGLTLSGDAAAVSAELEEAFAAFVTDARMEEASPPNEQARWASDVAKAANALALLLGPFDPGDDPEPGEGGGLWPLARNLPDRDNDLQLTQAAMIAAARDAIRPESGWRPVGDFDALRIALAAVPIIRRAAELTAEYWTRQKGSDAMRLFAERALMRRLCEAHRAAFGRKPTFTMPRGVERAQPTGPSLEWFRATLKVFLARTQVALNPSPRDGPWSARCAYLARPEHAHALAHAIRAAQEKPLAAAHSE